MLQDLVEVHLASDQFLIPNHRHLARLSMYRFQGSALQLGIAWDGPCLCRDIMRIGCRIPVVPHKAVAEVSKIGTYRPIGEVGCCESRMAERIHWWTERWLELCFLEWLQWLQRSPDVVWFSAVVVVVVVWCSGVVVVMCNKCIVAVAVVVVAAVEDRMLQNAAPLRKSAPWPPNISDEHVSCTAPATRNASFQVLFKSHTPANGFETATKPSRFGHFWQRAQSLAPATQNDIWTSKSGPNMWCLAHFDLEMCFASQRRALFRHLNFQKWSDADVFCTFWLGNVLRALFHISTSKSGPRMVCFVRFDLEMCFAPQRRALFRHLNFQKWSDTGVLCTFWLGNVFGTTPVCNLSSLIWPHGSAPATLASLLFDPPEPQHIEKTQRIATFLPFRAPASSFFWLFLFSDLLSSSLLFSSLLWLFPLPIPSVHIVRSLTSKLPSMIQLSNH